MRSSGATRPGISATSVRTGFMTNVLATVTRTVTGASAAGAAPAASQRASAVLARGDALKPKPLRGLVVRARCPTAGCPTGRAAWPWPPGASALRYAGSAPEITPMRPVRHDRAPPQCPASASPSTTAPFNVLAGVVLVAVAAADVHERRDDAARRGRERVDAERQPLLFSRQHHIVRLARPHERQRADGVIPGADRARRSSPRRRRRDDPRRSSAAPPRDRARRRSRRCRPAARTG